MKLLLDTHLLLWAAEGAEHVPADARILMESMENDLYFSVASLWEIAIKSSLNRADFQADARLLRQGLLENGYQELPVRGEHAVAVGLLPPIHKDPFDRLLIAQAIAENLLFITADQALAEYPASVQLVS